MSRLKQKEELKAEELVIDPNTVKIRKFPNNLTETELRDIMSQYGEVQRVKIPMDLERGTHKGVGFITFASPEVCTRVIESESIKYEFYEIQCERSYMSAGMRQQR